MQPIMLSVVGQMDGREGEVAKSCSILVSGGNTMDI